jgi:hypothetical protein
MHFQTSLLALAGAALLVESAPAPIGSPSQLQDRESACIALDDCPGMKPSPAPDTTSGSPPPVSSALEPASSAMEAASSTAPATSTPPAQTTAAAKFEWAVIGDSWSSGVAYSRETQYDSDNDFCFRTNEAWGAQMEKDTTWTVNEQDFHFAACGGSHMDAMKGQMADTGIPQLIVSNIGGNNAFFGTTVDNCVYQGNAGQYGNPYDSDPDGTGECKKSLVKTQDYPVQFSDSTSLSSTATL